MTLPQLLHNRTQSIPSHPGIKLLEPRHNPLHPIQQFDVSQTRQLLLTQITQETHPPSS